MAPDVAVCLSFDFDALSVWAGPHGSRSPVLLSRGEFGRVGAERLLRHLGEQGVPSTWFMPGHTIDTFPAVCEAVAAAGHEIGYHGYCHEPISSRRDPSEERQILERAIGCIERISGRPPVGSRVPGGNVTPRWVDLLLEYGFSYDSSLMADDFTPYYIRQGDEVRTDGPVVFGSPVDLVELPFDWSLDDWPYFSIHQPDHFVGLRDPQQVYDIWAGDFRYLYERVGNGVFILTMHPQCIGRGHRLLMLERLIAHLRSHDGVRFVTMQDAAREFRAAQPLPSAAG